MTILTEHELTSEISDVIDGARFELLPSYELSKRIMQLLLDKDLLRKAEVQTFIVSGNVRCGRSD